MIHESPYDQREQEARDEGRRQALQDAGEDEMNERRQLGDPVQDLALFGDALSDAIADCPELLDELIASGAISVVRSPPDDLTTSETRSE